MRTEVQTNTIYTPGHGLVADALIMHGVVRALAHMGIYDAWIERIWENRYRVVFKGESRKLIDVDIGESLLRSANLFLTEGTLVGPLKKIFDVNPKISDFREWASDLAQALPYVDLLDLVEDHKERRGEGCSKSVAHPPLYLPIGPEFKDRCTAEEGAHYRVCDTCFTLANLGLVYGATALVVREKSDIDVTFMSLVPTFRALATDVLLIQRMSEGYKLIERPVPTLAAPMYWLSTGETLYDGASEFDLVIWRVVKINGVFKVLNVTTVPAVRLMRFVAEVRVLKREWPKVVERVVGKAPEALAKLAEVVIYGGNTHSVVKQLSTVVCNGEPCLGDALHAVAEALSNLES